MSDLQEPCSRIWCKDETVSMAEMMRLEMKESNSRNCFIAIFHAVSISVSSHYHYHGALHVDTNLSACVIPSTISAMHAWPTRLIATESTSRISYSIPLRLARVRVVMLSKKPDASPHQRHAHRLVSPQWTVSAFFDRTGTEEFASYQGDHHCHEQPKP